MTFLPRILAARPARPFGFTLLALVALLGCNGCDRLLAKQRDNDLRQAIQRQAAGDLNGAVAGYEGALDGTARSGEAHFRLALLYVDKLDDPVSAIHHFRRYLALAPKGPYAKDAKANLDRTEPLLATKLGGGTLITRNEAARLKADNDDLRRQLAAARAPAPPANASGAPPTVAATEAERKAKASARTYKVEQGDTLAKISRKVYKDKTRWKDIHDANLRLVGNPPKLKPGMTLIIP